jgi:hypothetical protein
MGFFDFKTQLDNIIREYNSLKIISERVNIDKTSVLEFSELMLRKFHQLEQKLYYYEENKIEEKLKHQIEQNEILREEVSSAEFSKNALSTY